MFLHFIRWFEHVKVLMFFHQSVRQEVQVQFRPPQPGDLQRVWGVRFTSVINSLQNTEWGVAGTFAWRCWFCQLEVVVVLLTVFPRIPCFSAPAALLFCSLWSVWNIVSLMLFHVSLIWRIREALLSQETNLTKQEISIWSEVLLVLLLSPLIIQYWYGTCRTRSGIVVLWLGSHILLMFLCHVTLGFEFLSFVCSADLKPKPRDLLHLGAVDVLQMRSGAVCFWRNLVVAVDLCLMLVWDTTCVLWITGSRWAEALQVLWTCIWRIISTFPSFTLAPQLLWDFKENEITSVILFALLFLKKIVSLY